MLRVLRAFVWLRWRMLLNALERTGSRDRLGRFSEATESLMPVVLAIVMVPSALALAGLTGYAGWTLAAHGGRPAIVEAVRFLLITACVAVGFAPVLLPSRERTNAVRLLLLPISRRTLYAAHVLAMLAHPLLMLAAAMLVSLPLGLAAGGRPGAALLALAAGALLLGLLAALLIAVTAAAELLVRNRRRGEWVALLLFLLLPIIGLAAGILDGPRDERRRPQAEREVSPPVTVEARMMALLPSEPYVHVVRASADSRYLAAVTPLLALAAVTALMHGAAYGLFARVLGAGSVSIGGGTVRARSLEQVRRLPGLSVAASAVALTHIRMALRTPRGRFTLLSPLVMFVFLAIVLLRRPAGVDVAFFRLQSGISLAALTSFMALLAGLPFAMNQFAVDRAGLTLALLAPMETRTLLAGKAAGTGIIAAMPVAVCIAAAFVLFPGGDAALWLSIPLAIAATYLAGVPVAAALSAVFPRSVDLNSIGQGSNAHGAAAFLGTLTYLAGGASCLLLVLLATAVLNRSYLAPLFLVGWCGLCGLASVLLCRRPVADLLERRREHMAMLR